MDTLTPVLAPACIRLDVVATSVREVLADAALLLSAQHGLRTDTVLDALWEREQLASTALGQGVALPHARIKGLQEPHAAYLRLAPALAFDAPDMRPVTDVFVLLVPERATEYHLQLLAGVAALFAEPAFRDRLHQLADPAQACEAFNAGNIFIA